MEEEIGMSKNCYNCKHKVNIKRDGKRFKCEVLMESAGGSPFGTFLRGHWKDDCDFWEDVPEYIKKWKKRLV